MSHDQGAEGSDSAVYPELARANLLRMRGDYKAAEQQCITILRRYPNNATANILLGDICAEKGDLDQSMQWYELALDVAPENQAAHHKLEAVKQRFKEKETAQTVEQLGLPTTKSKAGIYAFALIASVFVFAVAMYLAGQRVGEKKQEAAQQTGSVKPSPDPTIDPGFTAPTPADGKIPQKTDSDLVKSIQSAGTEGARVLSAMQDPRTHALIVSYSVLEGEDPKTFGAVLAQQCFQAVTDAPVITLRAMKQGQVVFIADAMKSLYEETLTPSWTAEHQSDSNAWVEHILAHPWPTNTAATTNKTPPSVTGNQTTPPVQPGDGPPGDDSGSVSADTGTVDTGATTGKDDAKTTGGEEGAADTTGTAKADEGGTTADGAPPGDESTTTTTGE